MISSFEFVSLFGNKDQEQNILFGTVDSNYTAGRPSVVYDADLLSGSLSKPMPYLSSYTPAAGDRVMIVRGVIIGKIV